MDLNELAREQWEWVESVGWHNKTPLEVLALIASEVGEAVNECRGDGPTSLFQYELADVILRTLDLAYDMDIDIEQALLDKVKLNHERGTRGRVK